MSSREAILARLRARLERTPETLESARTALDAARVQPAVEPDRPLPAAAGLLEAFCQRATALASTVERVDTRMDVPAAVARYLSSLGLPLQAVCWPELSDLAWSASGMEVSTRQVEADDAVGITGCQFAVAQTGSLVLCSGADTPALLSVLPATHIAVLAAGCVRADMEAVWRALRRAAALTGEWPRAVNFVSGPSRTGDIEQTIVLGAHGPARLHVLMLCSE